MNGSVLKSLLDDRRNATYHTVACPLPKVGTFTVVELEDTKFPQYKYLEKKWALEFFRTGSLRIGTLYDFSRIEMHGPHRGDENEGARNYYQVGENVRSIVVSTSSIDSYMYCTSNVLSKKIADQFNADSALEIISIDFFFEISKFLSLNFDVPVPTIGPIKYITNEEVARHVLKIYESGLSEQEMKAHMPNFARLKDVEFASQAEVRAMWEPASPSARLWPQGRPRVPSKMDESISVYDRRHSPVNEGLRPINIHVPNARRYCKLIDYID